MSNRTIHTVETGQVENSSLRGELCAHFFVEIAEQIQRAAMDKCYVLLIRFDLDRFRKLNEQSGYLEGDRVLELLRTRIASLLGKDDKSHHLGADEFALSLGVNNRDEIEARVSSIYAALREPFDISCGHFQPRISIGAALYPDDCSDEESLMLAAESAQRHAKTRGGAQLSYYSNKYHELARYRARLEKDLHGILTRDELFLVYQPKVDASTGIIKGFEALLRWQHPERGLISPVDFIPVMEENRMIIEVGDWVFSEVCQALGRWEKLELPIIPVAVNVSMHQFKQECFVERLAEILQQHDINPELIEIEITESCLMDDGQENIGILEQLKAMGMSISIDDFGTGYSSLSYLKRFPIDTLKIDRSFITNVHNRRESDNAGIVTAIMALSHSLRLDVVAEGVETAQELAFLHALGCRTIQGFLFSKPLQEFAVVELLESSFTMAETLVKVRQELQAR